VEAISTFVSNFIGTQLSISLESSFGLESSIRYGGRISLQSKHRSKIAVSLKASYERIEKCLRSAYFMQEHSIISML
jgi:hypothetical protein